MSMMGVQQSTTTIRTSSSGITVTTQSVAMEHTKKSHSKAPLDRPRRVQATSQSAQSSASPQTRTETSVGAKMDTKSEAEKIDAILDMIEMLKSSLDLPSLSDQPPPEYHQNGHGSPNNAQNANNNNSKDAGECRLRPNPTAANYQHLIHCARLAAAGDLGAAFLAHENIMNTNSEDPYFILQVYHQVALLGSLTHILQENVGVSVAHPVSGNAVDFVAQAIGLSRLAISYLDELSGGDHSFLSSITFSPPATSSSPTEAAKEVHEWRASTLNVIDYLTPWRIWVQLMIGYSSALELKFRCMFVLGCLLSLDSDNREQLKESMKWFEEAEKLAKELDLWTTSYRFGAVMTQMYIHRASAAESYGSKLESLFGELTNERDRETDEAMCNSFTKTLNVIQRHIQLYGSLAVQWASMAIRDERVVMSTAEHIALLTIRADASFFLLDDDETALQDWELILHLDPFNATATFQLAELYFAAGEFNLAYEFYSKYLALECDDVADNCRAHTLRIESLKLMIPYCECCGSASLAVNVHGGAPQHGKISKKKNDKSDDTTNKPHKVSMTKQERKSAEMEYRRMIKEAFIDYYEYLMANRLLPQPTLTTGEMDSSSVASGAMPMIQDVFQGDTNGPDMHTREDIKESYYTLKQSVEQVLGKNLTLVRRNKKNAGNSVPMPCPPNGITHTHDKEDTSAFDGKDLGR